MKSSIALWSTYAEGRGILEVSGVTFRHELCATQLGASDVRRNRISAWATSGDEHRKSGIVALSCAACRSYTRSFWVSNDTQQCVTLRYWGHNWHSPNYVAVHTQILWRYRSTHLKGVSKKVNIHESKPGIRILSADYLASLIHEYPFIEVHQLLLEVLKIDARNQYTSTEHLLSQILLHENENKSKRNFIGFN